MATMRCKESFAADVNGVQRVVTAGQLLDSADPIVKGRDNLFEPVETYIQRNTPPVEQATAAPGEKRSVSPPKSRAGAKDS